MHEPMNDPMIDHYQACPPGGRVIFREEAQILVDGRPVFTDKQFTFDEAEEMIELCINGIGWPKQRSHYQIQTRTVVTAESPWRAPEKLSDPALIVLQHVAVISDPVYHDHVTTSIPKYIIDTARRALKK